MLRLASSSSQKATNNLCQGGIGSVKKEQRKENNKMKMISESEFRSGNMMENQKPIQGRPKEKEFFFKLHISTFTTEVN